MYTMYNFYFRGTIICSRSNRDVVVITQRKKMMKKGVDTKGALDSGIFKIVKS